MKSSNLIATEGLAAGYGAGVAIEGVTFNAEGGVRVALLGPNGGGKTTLMRTLAGDLKPMRGTMRLSGSCATVPQTDRSRLDYPVSALEVATMGALGRLAWWRRPGRRDRAIAMRALERVGVADLADSTYGELSGGQRQRVLIARGLVGESPILLLDEPFSGLDATSAIALESLIGDLAAEGRAVLIATHDLPQARRWDRVLCLNRTQIAFGDPDAILSRDVLERTYGGAIVELPDGGIGVLPPHHHHDHDHDLEDHEHPIPGR